MFNNSKFLSDNLKASYGPELSDDTLVLPNNSPRRTEKEYLGLHILDESILKNDDEDDYGFLPYKRPWLIQHYFDQRDSRWVDADIPLKEDRSDYDECDENIKEFVNGIIAFFYPADGLVIRNLFRRFQKDTSFWKECSAFYAEQSAMETVHSHVYSLMAETLIRDTNVLKKIQKSTSTYQSVGKIEQFCKKYMSRDFSLLERILAFACIEGILFNSAFTAVYWIKKRNILRGFCKANEYIARDEAIHFRFAVTLFLMISMRPDYTRLSKERVYEIVNEAVEINTLYINEILKADLIGLSNEDLISYTKCTADTLLTSLEYPILYGAQNPFDWMSVIQLPNKTNFFEDKVSEYAHQVDGEFEFDEEASF